MLNNINTFEGSHPYNIEENNIYNLFELGP